MSQNIKKTTPQESFVHFKQTIKTLLLSTIDKDGKPNTSYSPFICDEEGNFYIFVSQLASHTQDLLDNPDVSILLIEDETQTRQIYARQRVSYHCRVEVVTQDNSDYQASLNALEKRFGSVVELLRTLPDFTLFRLSPYQGQYVKGFGKAYKLTGDNLLLLEHINPSK